LINDRRIIPRVVLAVGAIVLASLMPAVRAPARPHMMAAGREATALQRQVVGLFDQVDEVRQVIESALAEMAWVHERISELSRQIDARQQLLNRRVAEAYMGARAVEVDSLLGASSFTALQDSLEFLDAVSQRDHEVVLSLQRRKAELEREQLRLEALTKELRRERERLEATVVDLVEKLQRQQALIRQQAEKNAPDVGSVGDAPVSSPPASPPAPSLAPGREAVIALIRDQFASLGSRTRKIALGVAEAESNFDPLAVNPSTGAAGVFQFLPSTWAALSEMAGRGDASVFDARANVAVAAWTVAKYGWHPWRSVAGDCGA
jgi:signal transduction histidine kinase